MKRTLLILEFVAAWLFVNCNGAVLIQAPEMKMVIMNETHVTVIWEMNSAIEDNTDFLGYNIYVYTDSIALLTETGEELNKFNSQPVQDTMFQADGLVQDSIYYIQVRTVNKDNRVGQYSSVMPFMQVSPRPEFTVVMKLAVVGQNVNDSCALRLSDATITADSVMADSGADIWVRIAGNTVSVVSPHIHPLYGVDARMTRSYNMGTGDFDAFPEATTEPELFEVNFNAGDILFAKTEDGNYVKIYVESIDAQAGIVNILYAYQNIAEFPYF
ncbi:hypothetical protein AMJ83_06535 [candidate division WOR_3 bacterium SM23_42]|uniref:Fibronectin type-III domain-containing protein n=1 Tax=candidate division WOR_3 bacterium SM23_42 TaxID=1703779 RepID=A0A0S8FS46_UNCW3|nr:MAG: hypothetical protein AMJ83_06535 [candidate division WOR_3 bacterium SM23_42]